ncbi:alpha/beta hydrolase [Nocardia sp. NPDC006630]|uniref:alpha/beta fold hydrolase n=1 Tax=Nocardia sp. NPDC006630 TaxID=3157181 RepID=UPI0033B4CCB1
MSSDTTVSHGDVTLPVTRSGSGPQLVFINGAGATQVAWKAVIADLPGYESITFDLRGHGKASTASTYKVADFLSDVEAVLAEVQADRPILIGWSLGADLALAYAAAHPGAVAGLVLVDGAVPIQQPLVTDAKAMRASVTSLGTKLAMLLVRLTPYRYAMPGNAFADLTLEVDERRQHHLLDTYRALDCPVSMLLATDTATGHDAKAERVNRTWREGAEVLQVADPDITVQWIEGNHKLPFSHPADIAAAINALSKQVQQPK